MGHTSSDGTQHRSACTECQRRKQKCNREWPCNHCQKRKVADKCSFNSGSSHSGPEKSSTRASNRKRQLSQAEDVESQASIPWDDVDCDFESLGYTASHLFAGLNSSSTRKMKTTPKTYKQYYMDAASCPQLKRSLLLLPARPYTDAMVQNFLNNANFHCYILYPSSFLEEYRTWWSLRSGDQPLGLQWTCLLLMVCACSTQYTNTELEQKLLQDLGQSAQRLSEQYHNAARELHSVIPVGNNHLLNVQSLLHSCSWYKSEARFVECWHVLSAAIREAQELGIHQETVTGPMSEFDREMRRRIWCILNTWDWQISALLSRPLIIDRSDCDVDLPSLTLEGYSPSPLLYIKLQSELICLLSTRFGNPKNVTRPADVQEYQNIVETWVRSFPPTYDLNHPDKSNDASRPWIVLHRFWLHTTTLSMLLDPIRAYLAKSTSKHSPADELQIRSDGIDYALRLMDSLHNFFNHVYPRDAKFHFVLFCIFDTAAVLCSTLMHDQEMSVPRQKEIFDAINRAVAMLKRLNTVNKTARTSYEVLVKVAQRIPRPAPAFASRQQASPKQRNLESKILALTPPIMSQAELAVASVPGSVESNMSYTTPPSEPTVYHVPVSPSAPAGQYCNDTFYAPFTSMEPDIDETVTMQPMNGVQMGVSYGDYANDYVNMTPPIDELYHNMNFGPISERELGDLALMWNYESLNLGFINPDGIV